MAKPRDAKHRESDLIPALLVCFPKYQEKEEMSRLLIFLLHLDILGNWLLRAGLRLWHFAAVDAKHRED
jgi:hypothetical protein